MIKKEKSVVKRIPVYLLISFLVIGVLYYLAPTPVISPKGIFLPAKNAKTMMAFKGDVEQYDDVPSNATVLGVISVMQHYKGTGQTAAREVAEYAGDLARLHGANGIVIKEAGYTLKERNLPEGLTVYLLRGEAIYVSGEKS